VQFASKVLLASIVLVMSTTTSLATGRALVMGIEKYEQSPLPGVPRDIENAKKIARSMGVEESEIVVRRDDELKLSGLNTVLSNFGKTVKQGDRVFIYFSGYGTSQSDGKSGCRQGLLSQDMRPLSKAEFQAMIKPIQEIAARTVVFIDTGFSGGLIATKKGETRDFKAGEARPKFLMLRLGNGSNDDCALASNYIKGTRDFDIIEKAQSTPNYYLLTAAGPNEYAIDGGPVVGSFATTTFLACLSSANGADKNRDGVISLDEARTCAQLRLNSMIRPPFLSQTLTVGEGLGGGATPVAFGQPPAPAAKSVTHSNSPVTANKIDSRQLLQTIQRNADQKHKVTLRSAKAAYKIKQDYLDLEVVSAKAGYLTLLSVGSSGRIFQLFPNKLDTDNHIEAEKPLRIPRPEWRMPANGPAGSNRFLAIVSNSPDRFANLGLPVANRFQAMDASADSARDILLRLTRPDRGCKNHPQRDFDVVEENPCSTAYGGALIDVREID